MGKWFLNFSFDGRSRRSHYWANILCWLAAFMLIGVAIGIAASMDPGVGPASIVVFLVATVWTVAYMVDVWAMTFRRAHDTGKSGWIALLLFIPIVNLLPLYWLLIQDSDQGPNKYGPPVKQFYQPAAT